MIRRSMCGVPITCKGYDSAPQYNLHPCSSASLPLRGLETKIPGEAISKISVRDPEKKKDG